MAEDARYGVEELAQLGGVSRRTIRYYIQEGLIPAPLGVGRGKHYSDSHLRQLIGIRDLQESGKSLDEIRKALAGQEPLLAAKPLTELPRQTWVRIILGDGLEMNVAPAWRIPSPGKLAELATWCHKNFRNEGED
jgi:DNA-binding transcriptional MerR regulator